MGHGYDNEEYDSREWDMHPGAGSVVHGKI